MDGTRYERTDDAFASRIEDEVVMLHPESGKYFGMDPVGSRIWDLLAEPRSLVELCAVLTSEYDVEPERCATEVAEFLGSLRAAGLLRSAP